jgi:hypothetical protein
MEKRNAQRDAKTIKDMANIGYTEEEISKEMGLSHRQFAYSITRWLSPNMAKKVQQQLRDNKGREGRTAESTQPVQEVQVEQLTPVQTENRQAIVIDASIINVEGIITKLKEVKNAIFVFPTVVIEELETMTKRSGFHGYNVRELLSIAIQDTSMVIPTATVSTLTGWSSNKDSLIIQIAMDMKEQYDVIVYSCDKIVIIKAKSLGLRYVYYKSKPAPMTYDSRPFTPAAIPAAKVETEELSLFRKVDEVGEIWTVEFIKKRNFHYIQNTETFPYYFSYENGKVTSLQGKVFVREGLDIYRIYDNRIEKLIIRNFDKSNNVEFVRRGVFAETITTITQFQVALFICELG